MTSRNGPNIAGGFADAVPGIGDRAVPDASASPRRWLGPLIFWLVVAGLVLARVALFDQNSTTVPATGKTSSIDTPAVRSV